MTTGLLIEAVSKSIVKCQPFLFLLALQVFFRSPSKPFCRRHVSNSFVLAPLIARLDTFFQRLTQILSACIRQPVGLCIPCFVEPLDLPVRLRVMRRESEVPDLEHQQVVFECMRKLTHSRVSLRHARKT